MHVTGRADAEARAGKLARAVKLPAFLKRKQGLVMFGKRHDMFGKRTTLGGRAAAAPRAGSARRRRAAAPAPARAAARRAAPSPRARAAPRADAVVDVRSRRGASRDKDYYQTKSARSSTR